MAKKMSLKAKIILGVTAAAAAGAVAVLVILLAAGGGETNSPGDHASAPDVSSAVSSAVKSEPGEASGPASSAKPGGTSAPGGSQIGDAGMDSTDLAALIAKLPNKDALGEMHSLFSGYWITTGDPYVGFIYTDGAPAVDYGLFQTSFAASGKITDARATGKYTMTLTIKIPAVPATAMEDAKPERTETVYIDAGNYNQHNTMRIKIENLGGGGWYTYRFGGGSLEDAQGNR